MEHRLDFGECDLALSLWHRPGLYQLLGELLVAGRESVGWDPTAALLTTARFCAQHSELGVTEYWHKTTARDDLLGVDTVAVHDERLYRALDQIGEHKNTLSPQLMQRHRQRFGVRFDFLLYGVTSIYLESGAECKARAQRGYSRDQSSGNKQVLSGRCVRRSACGCPSRCLPVTARSHHG